MPAALASGQLLEAPLAPNLSAPSAAVHSAGQAAAVEAFDAAPRGLRLTPQNDPRVLYLIAGGRYIRYEGNGQWAEFNPNRQLVRFHREINRTASYIQLYTPTPQKTWTLLTNTGTFWHTATDTRWRPGNAGGWVDPSLGPTLAAGQDDLRVQYVINNGASYIRDVGNGVWAEFNRHRFLVRFHRELNRGPRFILLFTNRPEPIWSLLTTSTIFRRTTSDTDWVQGNRAGWMDPHLAQLPRGVQQDVRVLYVIANGNRYIRYEGNGRWAEFNSQRLLVRFYRELGRNTNIIDLYTPTPRATWVRLTNTVLLWRTSQTAPWQVGSRGGWVDPGSFFS